MIKEINYNKLTKIQENPWDYILYKFSNGYILSVVCGSVGLYDTNILLENDQIENFKIQGKKMLIELAEKIRSNPEKYSSTNIRLK
jgi:hypothetical protein